MEGEEELEANSRLILWLNKGKFCEDVRDTLLAIKTQLNTNGAMTLAIGPWDFDVWHPSE